MRNDDPDPVRGMLSGVQWVHGTGRGSVHQVCRWLRTPRDVLRQVCTGCVCVRSLCECARCASAFLARVRMRTHHLPLPRLTPLNLPPSVIDSGPAHLVVWASVTLTGVAYADWTSGAQAATERSLAQVIG